MSQPYIFKKQIISIIVILLILVLEKLYVTSQLYFKITFFFLLVTLSITFVPIIRKYIKYPLILHTIFYYLPMILPIMFLDTNYKLKLNLVAVFITIIFSIILSLVGYKINNQILINDISSQLSISIKDLFNELFNALVAIIAEEIFFRYILIQSLQFSIGIYSIFFATILFVYAHFINRWANKMFNTKSYIYHLFTGLILGFMLYYSNSILLCIIFHISINSSKFILLYKQYTNRSKMENQLFNDY